MSFSSLALIGFLDMDYLVGRGGGGERDVKEMMATATTTTTAMSDVLIR